MYKALLAYFFLSLTTLQACPEHHGTIQVENPYAVFFQGSAGAAYVTLSQTAKETVKLIKVRWADAPQEPKEDKAPRVELHDHVHETDKDGKPIARMIIISEKDGISLPAADKDAKVAPVHFLPGGKHLMLFNFPDGVKNASDIKLLLTFEKTDGSTFEETLIFPVRKNEGDGEAKKDIEKKPCAHHNH